MTSTTTPIRLAALDVAGTTVDDDGAVYRALADAVRAYGTDPSPRDVARWMGAGKRDALRALLTPGDAAGPTDRTVDAAFGEFRRLLDQAYRDRPPRPVEGVPATLRLLHEHGVHVVLTTGFDREVVDTVLAAVGWDGDLLDAVVCVDDVAAGRPAPYLVFHAMERTGVDDVAAVLVAGDTPRDVESGLRAGAGLVVGVLTGEVGREDLAAAGAHHVLDSLNDVVGLLPQTRRGAEA